MVMVLYLIGIDRYHVLKESADTILCRYLPPKVSADADTVSADADADAGTVSNSSWILYLRGWQELFCLYI